MVLSLALFSSGFSLSRLVFGVPVFVCTVVGTTIFAVFCAFFGHGFGGLAWGAVYSRWWGGFWGGAFEALIGRWLGWRGWVGGAVRVFAGVGWGFWLPWALGVSPGWIRGGVCVCLRRLCWGCLVLCFSVWWGPGICLWSPVWAFRRLPRCGCVRALGACPVGWLPVWWGLGVAFRGGFFVLWVVPPASAVCWGSVFAGSLWDLCVGFVFVLVMCSGVAWWFFAVWCRPSSALSARRWGSGVGMWLGPRGLRVFSPLGGVLEGCGVRAAGLAVWWLIFRVLVTGRLGGSACVGCVGIFGRAAALGLWSACVWRLGGGRGWGGWSSLRGGG